MIKKPYTRASVIYGPCAVLMLFMAALFSENFANICFMLLAFAFAVLAGAMFGGAAVSGEFEKKEDKDVG